MLRQFAYPATDDIVRQTLERFDIELPDYFAIVRFEVISPDSFMWRLQIGDGLYYLYAEDYVPGLEHIRSVFNEYLENGGWSFVEPRKTIVFEDASPVQTAVTYQPPDDSDEMMRYAVDSGYDFVFLARSKENSDDAQFSAHAPRGFRAEKDITS
jgi:hypothetical protein